MLYGLALISRLQRLKLAEKKEKNPGSLRLWRMLPMFCLSLREVSQETSLSMTKFSKSSELSRTKRTFSMLMTRLRRSLRRICSLTNAFLRIAATPINPL
eukprot:30148_5